MGKALKSLFLFLLDEKSGQTENQWLSLGLSEVRLAAKTPPQVLQTHLEKQPISIYVYGEHTAGFNLVETYQDVF